MKGIIERRRTGLGGLPQYRRGKGRSSEPPSIGRGLPESGAGRFRCRCRSGRRGRAPGTGPTRWRPLVSGARRRGKAWAPPTSGSAGTHADHKSTWIKGLGKSCRRLDEGWRRGSGPARCGGGGGGERGATGEEGLWEEGDGVRVRVGCNIIYQGNTMRTIGSTIDDRKLLGYLGQHGLFCLLFFFFFFPFYCTIVK
jgi:hypothetical protein